jgi:hypothetical protein
MARGESAVCLGCSKKFKQSEYSLQCTICGLWIHKACSGITDELYNLIDLQLQQTGRTYWACRPCTVYSQGLTHRMKEIENQLNEVKATCSRNEDGLQKVQAEVSKLAETVSKQEKKVEEVASVSGQDVFAELRERAARKPNVVMYAIGEAPEERTGHERWDWDMKSCSNLFSALKLDVKMEGIKFCRRVGEPGGPPRPMIVGFYEERDRNIVLRCDTRGTNFKDVEIGPDQTKKQKQEEMDMKAEAVRRNREMPNEDRAKNLAWLVVGPRGEKRLVKKYVCLEMERRVGGGGVRGRDRTSRGTAGRGRSLHTVTGANLTPLGTGETTDGEEMEEDDERECEVTAAGSQASRRGRGRPPGTRTGPSKRKGGEADLGRESEPPAKY